VLYPHRSLLSAKVRSFVDLLTERFGPELEWAAAPKDARATD
jgi:hypothetical protein